LRTDLPAIGRYQQLAASVLHNLSNTIKVNPARRAAAHEALARAIDIQEKLVAMAPAVPDYLSKLATFLDGLASLHRAQDHNDDAEALYRKGLSYHSRLAAQNPESLSFRFGHGQALHNLADFLRDRGRLDDALSLSREAVQQFESLYKLNPQDRDYRLAISYAYWTVCTILLDRKDHRQAVAVVVEYLRVEPNGFEESSESAGLLCRCAQLCRDDPSVPAAERESLVRSYSDRAMDALRFAVGRGYRDLNALKSAPTYEPLRKRDDFQNLVRELETKSEAARPAR
jgi:tetratricopeptide (TPR) repeat protein